MDINQITTFLGWCTVINMGFLAFAAIFLLIFKDLVINIHSKLTGVSASKLPALYFSYMANYKIGILMFNLVPYIALTLMG
ncbi:hypothetical protein HWV00_11185 [Moritella sp. 24]|uniref:DUF6868 family protein n=1 Tax=Moritella sp. 24 TaxID=2746230 RepID=UPI001BA7AF45|nr:hypothetical protein [Moritella sp. 24]QUM76750.1 hypothetical protein HWV00_11185 [Moritella sp. 24]